MPSAICISRGLVRASVVINDGRRPSSSSSSPLRVCLLHLVSSGASAGAVVVTSSHSIERHTLAERSQAESQKCSADELFNQRASHTHTRTRRLGSLLRLRCTSLNLRCVRHWRSSVLRTHFDWLRSMRGGLLQASLLTIHHRLPTSLYQPPNLPPRQSTSASNTKAMQTRRYRELLINFCSANSGQMWLLNVDESALREPNSTGYRYMDMCYACAPPN